VLRPADRDMPWPLHFGSIDWPARLTLDQFLDVARGTMRCETCEWAVRPGDECAEQAFVLGCIHWKQRSK